MDSSRKSHVLDTICFVAALSTGLVAILMAGSPGVQVIAAGSEMPTAQQNSLVAKYCTVCHTDTHPSGGLSLQHFDAAFPDPGVEAMLVSKLKAGAIGAAGLALPEKSIQAALVSALSASAAGANDWILTAGQDPVTQAATITASSVQSLPSTKNGGEPDLYRLTVTCRAATHEGAMQLAWSPNVPPSGQVMSATVDGAPLATYKIEGTGKMGNGSESGPGAILLLGLPLPTQTLTITNPFPDQTVMFSFGDLSSAARQQLSACFGAETNRQKP